jgi:hypothetical protein
MMMMMTDLVHPTTTHPDMTMDMDPMGLLGLPMTGMSPIRIHIGATIADIMEIRLSHTMMVTYLAATTAMVGHMAGHVIRRIASNLQHPTPHPMILHVGPPSNSISSREATIGILTIMGLHPATMIPESNMMPTILTGGLILDFSHPPPSRDLRISHSNSFKVEEWIVLLWENKIVHHDGRPSLWWYLSLRSSPLPPAPPLLLLLWLM